MKQTFIRKLHRWLSIATALQLLLLSATGMLLLLKKDIAWIQPPAGRGSGIPHQIELDSLLAAAVSHEEMDISSWQDIQRVDIRPERGIAKIIGRSRKEMQVDLATGKILTVSYRRSDAIEALHDGSYIHPLIKYIIFVPSGFLILLLWVTGIFLLFPKWRKKPC